MTTKAYITGGFLLGFAIFVGINKQLSNNISNMVNSPSETLENGGRGKVLLERTEIDRQLGGITGVDRIRAVHERLGAIDSIEANSLLAQVGVIAARSYLLTRPQPLEPFDQMLANALVIRIAKDSVYEAIAIAVEVGVKSLAEYEYVCSALELKCFLDCDRKAYDFLRNHPLIIARVDARGHLTGSEICVVKSLREMGLPLSEIKNRFDAFERPDFLTQVERWIEGGGASDSSTFGGGQAMLNELGAFDKRLRISAAAQLGQEGVTRGDYLARNPWLQGEDRLSYYSTWADSDPSNALEWAGQHDREYLPIILGKVFQNKAIVKAWFEKQTDPEIKNLYVRYNEIARQADERQ